MLPYRCTLTTLQRIVQNFSATFLVPFNAEFNPTSLFEFWLFDISSDRNIKIIWLEMIILDETQFKVKFTGAALPCT